MMKEVIVHQIDSFTKEKFKGNPAGVVLNAENLTSR
jgi:predicted PhzF superfamily epimerase YddE/YHI9